MPEVLCEELYQAFNEAFEWMIRLPCLLDTVDKCLQLKPWLAGRHNAEGAWKVVDLGLHACTKLITVEGKDVMATLTGENERWVHHRQMW